MDVRYFKRFRMDLNLRGRDFGSTDLPTGYRFYGWNSGLVEAHGRAKYRSFCREIDAEVFPCLGHADGCIRLMREISRKEGFLPSATWLLGRTTDEAFEACGTIQGICDRHGCGAVQNLGIVPEFRGIGLGELLLRRALLGFQEAGLSRVFLEVTADNEIAIRLYERLGFRCSRTSYKAVGLVEPTVSV